MGTLVYMDSDLVVLSKRSGEAVAGRRPEHRALITEWRRRLGEPALQPVHRIDQPVSGLVVLSRNRRAFANLQRALQAGAVRRVYLAVVDGTPDPPSGVLEDRIAIETGRNRSRIDEAGKESRLTYELIGRTDHHAVLKVTLDTGRHHQIRVQLGSRGWHVVGDAKYGARRAMSDRSIALHARYLSFPHPSRPVRVACIAPMPERPLWRAVRELYDSSSEES